MLSRVQKRAFSDANSYARVIKYRGDNLNVASHNMERRQEFAHKFSFGNTWGIGVEGFSKATHLQEMNPIIGGKREFTWLLAAFLAIPVLAWGRNNNEDGLASKVKATNRYARLNLDSESARPSQWK